LYKVKKAKPRIIILVLIIFSLNLFSTLLLYSNPNEKTQLPHKSDELHSSSVSVIIIVNGEEQAGKRFVQGTSVKFRIIDDNYKSISIQLKGTTQLYSGSFSKSLIGAQYMWEYVWDTQKPLASSDDPVLPDNYEVTVTIVKSDDSTQVFSLNEPIQIYSSTGLDVGIVIVIAIIICAVVVSSLIVVIKRRGKKEKIEFADAEKIKKKKSEIYSGASAIGKESGKLAEEKLMETKSPYELIKPKEEVITSAIPLEPSAPIKPKVQEDFKFSLDSKKLPAAAVLKASEMNIDLDKKVDFLTSKIDSVDQNVTFFKEILKRYPSEEYVCPICNSSVSKNWRKCPFCQIKEHADELGMKQAIFSVDKQLRICTECKNLILAKWIDCPHCIVKKSS